MQPPTKDQFAQWKTHPVSEWFFLSLQKRIHDLSEDLILGTTVDSDSVDRTAIQTARIQASAQTLYEVHTAQWEEVCETLGIELEIEEEDGREDNPFGVAGVDS